MEKSICSFCDKSGILIYPVRYAVACPAGASGVPGLSGTFRIEDAPEDISPAKFALRSLRSGYLYVYDEKRKQLKGFIVQSTGALFPFELAYDPVQRATGSTHSCSNPMSKILPSCFSIEHSDADPAARIWCGWSNTFWTKRLRSKIDDVVWRKQHMQSIDVPSLINGSVPHAAEFQLAAKSVAHFVVGAKGLKNAFGFSAAPIDQEAKRFYLRSQLAASFVKNSYPGKGFVVALNDPVGLANDLSELTLPTSYAG